MWKKQRSKEAKCVEERTFLIKSLYTLKNTDVRNVRAGELPQAVPGNGRDFSGFVIGYKGLHNEWEMNDLKI